MEHFFFHVKLAIIFLVFNYWFISFWFKLICLFFPVGIGGSVVEINMFIFSFFYCCSNTVVSIFLPPLLPSHPQSFPPLALSMSSLYMFLDEPSLSFPCYLPSTPLWLLSVCSLCQCLWLYFACLFVLLISLKTEEMP